MICLQLKWFVDIVVVVDVVVGDLCPRTSLFSLSSYNDVKAVTTHGTHGTAGCNDSNDEDSLNTVHWCIFLIVLVHPLRKTILVLETFY